jgi:hypothetical protein
MTSKIRTAILATGLAAMVSSQAVYAAPARATLDPLVSLSALGSSSSRTALCASTAAAAAAAAKSMTATAAAAAAQAPAPGCLFPVVTTPPPVVTEVAPPVVTTAETGKSIGMLPLILGLAAIAGLAALLLLNDDDDDGVLVPVTPA